MLRSGALNSKILLVMIIENNKNVLILGQVRLSKSYLCPTVLKKKLV